jgi:16S rRNA (cytosine1402-N4)-methyltransferase
MNTNHEPVLVDEVIHLLKTDEIAHLNKRVTFVDGTLGFGGHSKEFIKRGIFVFGIDTDESTLEYARENLSKACPGSNRNVGECFKLAYGNFRDIDHLVTSNNITDIYGILLDLGVSTPQLTSNDRGLSFANPKADLDMRLDRNSGVRASDLLNALDEKQLQKLFEVVMDYPEAKRLARVIRDTRQVKRFETVGDLLDVIDKGNLGNRGMQSIHPATKPFMALRMAVNTEIPNLETVLPKAFDLLEPGGRLAVISFHSGEDKVVKDFMRNTELGKYGSLGKVVTKKPIVPGSEEVYKNPKARSAKLRIIEKL